MLSFFSFDQDNFKTAIMLSWKKKLKEHIRKDTKDTSLSPVASSNDKASLKESGSASNLSEAVSKMSLNRSSTDQTSSDEYRSNTVTEPSGTINQQSQQQQLQSNATSSAQQNESVEARNSQTLNGSTTVNQSDNSNSTSIKSDDPTISTIVKPGCLTVKVYSGKNFKLPFDLVLNEFILQKIAACADDCDKNLLNENIKSSVEKSQLTNSLNDLLSGDLVTGCLPAIVSVPSNDDNSSGVRNPLIYITVEFDKNVSLVQPSSGLISDPSFNNVSSFDVNGNGMLVVQIFVKIPNILIPKSYIHLINSKTPSQDILIGSIKIPLNLNYNSKKRILDHEWLNLTLPTATNNNNISSGTTSGSSQVGGALNITIEYKPNKNKPLTIDDFDLLKVIGKGSFGKVMQVRKKDTQRVYALKSIRKAHIVAKLEVNHTLAERNVLVEVNNPFIVSLKFCFQSPDKLYFVLVFINGGELFHHLQREGRFSLDRSRFYICELLSAIECLHSLDVIYRDLKPENILLDYQGHIALCDFGLCKRDMKLKDRTETFCGTPEYLAPELLLGQGYTRSVDWWTLGILLYEMLTGLPPFYDENIPKMYKKILGDPLKFPEMFDTQAKDLLIKLLDRNPNKRLGANGSQEIKDHPFFRDIDWVKLNNKGYTPPFKPPVTSAFDTNNFDSEFTSEIPADSVVTDHLSRSMQKQFEGWTYVGESKLSDAD